MWKEDLLLEKQPLFEKEPTKLVFQTKRVGGQIIEPKEKVLHSIPLFNQEQIWEWRKKKKMEKATTALALWTWAVQWDQQNTPRVIRKGSGATYFLRPRPDQKTDEDWNRFTAVLTITHQETKTRFLLYGSSDRIQH